MTGVYPLSPQRPLSTTAIAFWLFCASAAVYNLNFRECSEEDTIATRFVPVSLLREGDIDLDEFAFLHEGFTRTPHYLRKVRGHYLSTSPILPAILALPVYFVANQLGLLRRGGVGFFDDVTFTSKVAASLIAAASVAALFAALTRITTRRRALIVSLVYAFATSTWSISSQGLWQHGPCQLFFALMLLFFLDAERDEKRLKWAGLSLALTFASRPGAALLMPIFTLFAIHRHRRRALGFLVLLGVGVACMLAYNVYFFGNARGAYAQLVTEHVQLGAIERPWALGRVPGGLAGLLISPSRGLFIFSPILLFALLGIPRRRAEGRHRLLSAYVAAAIGAWLLAGSAFFSWWAGWVYGPRYVVDVMPLWCLLLVRCDALFVRPPLRVVGVVLGVWSVAVQAVGALCYPAGWNWEPENVDLRPARLWDWSDSQILRCVRKGSHPDFFEQKSERHAEQGLRYWAADQVKEALSEGLRAVQLDRRNVRAHRLVGNAYFTTGRHGAAERHYHRALALETDSALNLTNMGNAAVAQGRLGEALRWYGRALEIDPDFASAHFNLGLVFERGGDRAKAAVHYRRCLEIDPKHTQAAQALERLGRS